MSLSLPVLPAAPVPVRDAGHLDELAPESKLLSLRTGHVWWVRDAGAGPRWAGSGGMFSDTDAFMDSETPLFLIWEPSK